MKVDLELSVGDRRQATASSVVIRNEFQDPLVVVVEINNAVMSANRGDPQFEQLLKLAGVKVESVSTRRVILPDVRLAGG